MPTLVLPEFPSTSGHRRPFVQSPIADPETVCVSACNKLIPAVLCRGEGEWSPSPAHSSVLAVPDVAFGADFSSESPSVGDSDPRRSAISASGQDLAPSTGDL